MSRLIAEISIITLPPFSSPPPSGTLLAPVVRVLLAHGANPNETEGGRDRSGRSALSLACVRGFSAVVDVLLADAPGLKVDGYSTNTDHIPLLVAIRFRHESIAL